MNPNIKIKPEIPSKELENIPYGGKAACSIGVDIANCKRITPNPISKIGFFIKFSNRECFLIDLEIIKNGMAKKMLWSINIKQKKI